MKDSFYFSHDANARHDPRMLALRSVYGAEGYGRFWMLVEILREQEGYRLKLTKYIWQALASELQWNERDSEKFVADCVEEFQLLETDGEFLWSPSLLRRMAEKDSRREMARQAAKARWENPGTKDRVDEEMQPQCVSNAKKEKKEKEEKEEKETREEKEIPFDEIIFRLNQLCGTRFRVTERYRKFIRARWREGHRLADFTQVLEKKAAQWRNTERARYLRPETLFGTKFETYLQELEFTGGGKTAGKEEVSFLA